MKRIILILLVAFTLGSCIKEDRDCPMMYVRFVMEDPYLEGDFDSRVGNDVLLYIFKDNILTYEELIPYASIAGGAEYAISKTDNAAAILGDDIKLVAWAVNAEAELNDDLQVHDAEHPEYPMGCVFDEQRLVQIVTYAGTGMYATHSPERYIGTRTEGIKEKDDHDSYHTVTMHPAPGRIVVNLNDPGGYLDFNSSQPHVVVNGTQMNMNLDKQGFGGEVTVANGISSTQTTTRAGENTHSTGIFGVLPSSSGQTLSVQITGTTQPMPTLVVHTDDNLHESIQSGELLEFDYTLGSMEFTISIGSWIEKIYIVDGM